jgi:hypothetical protein
MLPNDHISACTDDIGEATIALGEIADSFCAETNLLVQDLLAARVRVDRMNAVVEAIASTTAVLTAELQTAGAIPLQGRAADDAFSTLHQEHARLRHR